MIIKRTKNEFVIETAKELLNILQMLQEHGKIRCYVETKKNLTLEYKTDKNKEVLALIFQRLKKVFLNL